MHRLLKYLRRHIAITVALSAMFVGSSAWAEPDDNAAGSLETMAEQMESALWAQIEPVFASAVDRQRGGFHESSRSGGQRVRSVVYQARLVWVAAELARRRPAAEAGRFKAHAAHGIAYLSDTLWDTERGGFFWRLTEDGQHHESLLAEKHVYGQAFAVFAAANAARVLDDPKPALDLAIRGYRWIEDHAADAEQGGYFEAMAFDGAPILERPQGQRRKLDSIGTAYGFKSMNSHIHLLEAYTALYHVWPDDALRLRLEQLLLRVRDVIQVEPGALHMFFTRDWRAVPNGNSFGHDVETAFLLIEAAEALGDPWPEQTHTIARRLVDHALEWGFDEELGGFYDHGGAFRPPYDQKKVWWVQAEGVNALALMHQRHGRETDRYRDAMRQTWSFIREHVIDPERGVWRPLVHRDGAAIGAGNTADRPEDIYHTARAMIETSDRLRKIVEAER